MIIEAVVRFVLGLVSSLLGFLAGFVGLGSVGTVTSGVVVGYSFLDAFLPVHEVLLGIAALVTLYVFLFGYRLFREFWSLVPVIGGHG